jgi:hypothetical protein
MDKGMLRDQIANERPDITAGRDSFIGGAGQNVNAIDPGDMNDHFPIVLPAEGEPGVLFIRETAIRVDLQAGLDEGGLDPIKFRQLMGRPVPVAPE